MDKVPNMLGSLFHWHSQVLILEGKMLEGAIVMVRSDSKGSSFFGLGLSVRDARA